MTDDTAAIARAISENIDKSRYRANPFVYFPRGTYLVSGPIEGRILAEGRDEGRVWSAGWRSMCLLLGESRDHTIIRLRDSAPGYGDAATPRWVVATGSEHDDKKSILGGGNRAFRHGIINLTIDVGSGNPGAIGIDFVANNRGTVEDVTIRAPKDSGHTALNLRRWWPGPALIHRVEMHGFQHAIVFDHYQYGMTFESITIRQPRGIAVLNGNNVAVMRRVHYTGSQPFYEGKGGHNLLALLDSTLESSGGASGIPAIRSGGILNLRRVTTVGFDTVVEPLKPSSPPLPGQLTGSTCTDYYDQGSVHTTGTQPPHALNLPIDDIPELPLPTKADAWVDGGSTSESLQAAIDSGARFIFLRPVKSVVFSKPVILRKQVELIMGLHASIDGPGDTKATDPDSQPPAFIFAEGDTPVVTLQHIFIGGRVEHPSKRTLVLRHCDIEQHGLHATGSGKTHVVDVIGRNYRIERGHTFFARQLNAEFGPAPLFTNAGTSCILGFKMESSTGGSKDAPRGTPSLLNREGCLEVIGGLLYSLGSTRAHAPQAPAFTNTRGTLSVSYRLNGKPDTYYPTILRQGTLEAGTNVPTKIIPGPGAALLFDMR